MGVANCRRIVITLAGRSGARIRFADRSYRAPEIVMIFGFPNAHCGIGHCDVHQREQPRELERTKMRLVGNVDSNLIVEPRRCTETWGSVVRPERADERLLRRALCGCSHSVPAKVLRFVIGAGIPG